LRPMRLARTAAASRPRSALSQAITSWHPPRRIVDDTPARRLRLNSGLASEATYRRAPLFTSAARRAWAWLRRPGPGRSGRPGCGRLRRGPGWSQEIRDALLRREDLDAAVVGVECHDVVACRVDRNGG
jgi:hypothetical protein